MFIAKVHKNNVYTIADKMEWSNVDAAVPAEVEAALRSWQAQFDEVQQYLNALYMPLRQTGGADISQVKVPACLTGSDVPASKKMSKTGSAAKKSSTSTKQKPSSSGSQSSEDTSA